MCFSYIYFLLIIIFYFLSDFNSARGHEQEHEFYLNDLRQAPWLNNVYTDDEEEDAEGGAKNKSFNDSWTVSDYR